MLEENKKVNKISQESFGKNVLRSAGSVAASKARLPDRFSKKSQIQFTENCYSLVYSVFIQWYARGGA